MVVEANKAEAERCVDIALRYAREGNRDKALKFLNKAISLHPLKRAKRTQSPALHSPAPVSDR